MERPGEKQVPLFKIEPKNAGHFPKLPIFEEREPEDDTKETPINPPEETPSPDEKSSPVGPNLETIKEDTEDRSNMYARR